MSRLERSKKYLMDIFSLYNDYKKIKNVHIIVIPINSLLHSEFKK